MNLRSKTLGNILFNFLWIDLGLTVLLLINTIIAGFIDMGPTFSNYHTTITSITALISLIYGIIFLIWIFNVHRDLQELNHSYPIKPGGAIARVLIPFYNIYGLWNLYSTMAHYFSAHIPNSGIGRKLEKYLPIYYILLLGSTILNYIVANIYAADVLNRLWLLSYAGDGATTVMYILMLPVITSGLRELAVKKLNQE